MAKLALRRREPEPDATDDAFAFAGGLLMGALIGALIALFLAPSEGRALRQRLRSMLGMDDGMQGGAGASDSGAAGADDPLLAPRDVAAEERVAHQRLPAYSH